jgi:2-dehydropantoate 2-reductase
MAHAGIDVHFLARGAHLKALQERGLQVQSVKGDFEVKAPATDRPEDIGPSDYVLFCVKSYDTEQAVRSLGPLVGRDTAVLSLQNGIDNEEKIADQIGWQHVMGGVAYLFSSIAQPGVVEHIGAGGIAFGEMDGHVTERAQSLLELFRKAEIDAELSDNINGALWEKFIFICALAGTTAVTRLSIGEIRSVPETFALFRRIAEEVRSIADAEGVRLAPDVVDREVARTERLEPEGLSSLHYDMTHGKRMELEAIHGAVVRRAQKLGLDVPVTEAIYALLKPWALRNERLHRTG